MPVPQKVPHQHQDDIPRAINGISPHSGPIPTILAMMGETTATAAPDMAPQVMTETISSAFTRVPVTRVFPRGAVTACTTINSAIKTAVRVIHNVFSLLFMMMLPFF